MQLLVSIIGWDCVWSLGGTAVVSGLIGWFGCNSFESKVAAKQKALTDALTAKVTSLEKTVTQHADQLAAQATAALKKV